jgi:hypothetical protein
MTRGALTPGRRRSLEIIEELRFGRIERLSIRSGEPCFEGDTRIVEEVKMDSAHEPQPDHTDADLTLKAEFENFFNRLSRLSDGVVDVEIRHSLPFRLAIHRDHRRLIP